MNANKKISTLIISSILVLNAGSIGISTSNFRSIAESSVSSNQITPDDELIINLNESSYNDGGVAAIKNGDIYSIDTKDVNSSESKRKIDEIMFKKFREKHNESQNTIKISENVLLPDNSSFLFEEYKGNIEISNQIETNNITSLNSAFKNTEKANPDLSNWDTSNVKTMKSMFENAKSANPDTSKWDTSKVDTTNKMFKNAVSANPDTSKWNTINIEDMQSMFEGAISTDPDVSSWDTSTVYDMGSMFEGATKANPDVSGWNTSTVFDMGSMFYEATSADPDVSNWDTSEVDDISFMFNGATSANPDVSNWNTSKVEFYEGAFVSTNLKALDAREFVFSDEVDDFYDDSIPVIAGNENLDRILFNYNPDNLNYIPLNAINLTSGEYELNRINDNLKFDKNREENIKKLTDFKIEDENIPLSEIIKDDLDTEISTNPLTIDYFEIVRKKTDSDKSSGGSSSGGGGGGGSDYVSEEETTSKNHVILASGDKYTDVLTATVLANEKKCPILLSEKNKVSENTLKEIKRLKTDNVIISGGPQSVSNNVVSQLEKEGYKVKRIAGQNRYETSKKIGEEVRLTSKNKDEAILVDGTNFPDVITISALANQKGAPILLTEPESLNKTTENVLKDWEIDKVTIGGEKKSVSQEAENKIKATAKTVDRLGGHDRYETAYKVANEVRNTTNNKKDMILVDGTNFPDGITISSLSAKFKSPILLTTPNKLHPTTAKAINDWTIENILIGGGYSSVSKTTEDSLNVKNKERVQGNNRYNTAVEISKRYSDNAALGSK
ncbi:MAG: BspA family leucine-rich repeat surface protein [Peptostreptococcus sp.]|uniref:BspA family leucine-rich repeat surface protein n=1 Tax=Peptostreptococcus sp. TaxID=1262 RepID=UPI002FCB2144